LNEIETRRAQFVAGEIDELNLTRYGAKVKLNASDGAVQLYVSHPRRRQIKRRPDRPELRKKMLEAADKWLADLQAPPPPKGKANLNPDIVTPREIWLSCVEAKLGVVPDDVLNWGRRSLEIHYPMMKAKERQIAPTFASVMHVLVAARTLDTAGAVPLDCEIGTLKPADLNRYVSDVLKKGGSPHTPMMYLRRFHTAVEQFRRTRPERWGAHIDPTVGMDPVKTILIKTEEIGD
jgi:hypothetical protein